MRNGAIGKLLAVVAGMVVFLATDCFAQTADTVSVVNPPFQLSDSTVVNAMPDEMPYAVRTVGSRPEVRQDSTIATQPPQSMSREERRQARKARKQPIELSSQVKESFRVSGGVKAEALARTSSVTDSLTSGGDQPDSLLTGADGIPPGGQVVEQLSPSGALRDSTVAILQPGVDGSEATLTGTLDSPDSLDMAALSRRDRRIAEKAALRADTTLYRHNPFLKDTMGISKMTLISLVAPGFGQFYNQDYWKIPILYGTVGAGVYFGIKEHKQYKKYKDIYDYRVNNGFTREFIDPVQNNMIIHNTYRQLFFGAAIASYIYFIADGAINYPSTETRIKTATTLSTICPGLGQIYNQSYWRVPIIVGGFATMLYVIDWNNRHYKRFKTAFDLEAQGLNNEFTGTSINLARMQTEKDNARRNRDLCIILTGALYIVNIIDAHVDAHLKDYDVSDDLAMRIRLEPTMNTLYTQKGGNTNWFGFNLCYTF